MEMGLILDLDVIQVRRGSPEASGQRGLLQAEGQVTCKIQNLPKPSKSIFG